MNELTYERIRDRLVNAMAIAHGRWVRGKWSTARHREFDRRCQERLDKHVEQNCPWIVRANVAAQFDIDHKLDAAIDKLCGGER